MKHDHYKKAKTQPAPPKIPMQRCVSSPAHRDNKPKDQKHTDHAKNKHHMLAIGAAEELAARGVEFTLVYPSLPAQPNRKEQSIWTHLLDASDADTAHRLRNDPAFQTDPLMLTVQLDEAATKGFSVSVEQLAQNRALWVPELDVFVTAREPLLAFEEHQKELEPWKGKRILDQVHHEPEATYEQFTSRWEDMGSPAYKNPRSVPPGHIVCVTWDSAIPKFGIDRLAGASSDYGNPDKLHFAFDFDERDWRKQLLTDALPVIPSGPVGWHSSPRGREGRKIRHRDDRFGPGRAHQLRRAPARWHRRLERGGRSNAASLSFGIGR
jgi:hypothetical protein